MCFFLSQTHDVQVWNGIWNDLIWSSSQQSRRQHLCVRPHNEEISTSRCYVTIWTVLPEARAELRWAEQSGAENSLILLAAPMNGPYSVPLKTDRNQQSNTNRLILQSSNAWVTHQSHLVMHISTQILYKAQYRHCTSVCVWSYLHTSVNINAWVHVFLFQALCKKVQCHLSTEEIMCFSGSSGSNADTLSSVYWSQRVLLSLFKHCTMSLWLWRRKLLMMSPGLSGFGLKILELCSFRLEIQCFKRSGHVWGSQSLYCYYIAPNHNLYSETALWEM